jgi:hypothetical protein
MKHEILEEVWRVREEISAACGHNLKKLAGILRREEAKDGDRLVRLPVRRQPTTAQPRKSATKRVTAERPKS